MGAAPSEPAPPEGSMVMRGESLLDIARSGTAEQAIAALTAGEPINQVDFAGMTPIHVAAFFRYIHTHSYVHTARVCG